MTFNSYTLKTGIVTENGDLIPNLQQVFPFSNKNKMCSENVNPILIENYQTSSGTNSAKGGQFVQLVKT